MKKAKRMLGVAAVVADLTGLLTGCVTGVVDLDDDGHHSGQVEVTASFSSTMGLEEQTSIRVVGANGSIRIWGIPGAQAVTVDAVRKVRAATKSIAESHLADVQVKARAWADEFEIRTIQPGSSHGLTYAVDYEITVPSHLVHKVMNGNGAVRLDGIHADVEVANGNGGVSLLDIAGSSWVNVGNGGITTRAFLPDGGQLVHAVGNGAISLSIQPQVSATFGAKVGNGTISLTGLHLENVVSTPRLLKGVLGTGDGLIDLSSGNGVIRVEGG